MAQVCIRAYASTISTYPRQQFRLAHPQRKTSTSDAPLLSKNKKISTD